MGRGCGEMKASFSDGPRLLSWGAQVDGRGSLRGVEAALGRLSMAGVRIRTLTIAPLSDPWDAPQDPSGNRFKSGCGPILALERAQEILGSGAAEAVVIRGEDHLRSGYGPRERREAMAIWPGLTIPEAYTDLARFWAVRQGLSRQTFRSLCDALIDSNQRTALRLGLPPASPESRSTFVTDLFTLADCANPVVDFAGVVLLGGQRASEVLGPSWAASIRLKGVAVEVLPDGPEHAEAIAGYEHLSRAFRRLAKQTGEDLASLVRAGEALCEAYTCFPPVPLGFLLATEILSSPAEIPDWLAARELTVTGGMNLARAPWNNPVLHALVVMADRLAKGGPSLGLLHGNGGLGGFQGVALLGATRQPSGSSPRRASSQGGP